MTERISARITDKKILIAFSGKYGSGKDAAAIIIRRYFPEFTCLAFADRLKQVVAAFVGVPVAMLYTREGKAFLPPGFDQTPGKMLQTFGDQFKLLYGEDVWARLTMNQAASTTKTIITDCRCLIEAEAINAVQPHLLIRIEGDPVGLRRENKDGRNPNHTSETELDDYHFEHVVRNDSSLEEYERKLLTVVVPWLYSLIQ